MKNIVLVAFFCFIIQTVTLASPIMLGSIRFKGPMNQLESLPIYHNGHIIKTVTNSRHTKITFEIMKERYQRDFLILVTEKIIPVNKMNSDGQPIYNTFDYWKVPEGQSYKLFHVQLNSFQDSSKNKKKITYSWTIQEIQLDADGKIPDQAVIILCLPEMVEDIEGGSDIELPTIHMNMNDLADTKKSIEDRILKMHMTSLDTNTLHLPIKKMIAWEEKKVIIALE